MKYDEIPQNLEEALSDYELSDNVFNLINELCNMYSALYGDYLDLATLHPVVIDRRIKKLRELITTEFEDTPRNRAIKLTQILKLENLEEY